MSFYTKVEGATKVNFRHYASLKMPYRLVSFFAEVKIFGFWPKTIVRGFDQN